MDDEDKYEKVELWWNYDPLFNPETWSTLSKSQKRYVYAKWINDECNTPNDRLRIKNQRIAELGS